MMANQRDLAAGVGVTYHSLTGDLSDVNFSSGRLGALNERDNWRVLQRKYAIAVKGRIHIRWLQASMLNNVFGVSASQEEEFLERFSEHKFQGRRWSWTNPKDDLEAIIKSLAFGITTPQEVAAELGKNVEDLLDDIKTYQDMLKTKGITLPLFDVKGNAQPEVNKDQGNGKKD